MINLISVSSTILYPVDVDVSEAVLRNTGQSVIIILVHRAGKCRIKIDIVLVQSGTQIITNTFVIQPRFKFCGSYCVVYNALKHFKIDKRLFSARKIDTGWLIQNASAAAAAVTN